MRIRTIGVLAALVLAVPLATAGLAQANDVDVQDNDFDPPTLTVTAGETVTWTSSGNNPHTVTADDGSFDSSPGCESFADGASGACLDNGDSFQQEFTEPGTYAYHCKIHGSEGGGGMSGTIVVEAASTDGGSDGGDSTTDGASAEGEVSGSITVSDQTGDGSSVTVDSVTISGSPGFVVVHADNDGSPGAVIGHVSIPEGTSTDVSVPLDSPLSDDATVWPMLHEDAGTVGTYEFPGADGPVSDDSGVVVKPLAYTVDSAETLPRTGTSASTIIVLALLAGLVIVSGGWFLLQRDLRQERADA